MSKNTVIVRGNKIVFVDVDNTLVMNYDEAVEANDGIDVSLHNVFEEIEIPAPLDGRPIKRYVNHRNVDLLKTCALMGSTVVVWSQSGVEWAIAVVRRLGLHNEFVDLIVAKPTLIIDDLEAAEFMPKAMWKHPKGKKK